MLAKGNGPNEATPSAGEVPGSAGASQGSDSQAEALAVAEPGVNHLVDIDYLGARGRWIVADVNGVVDEWDSFLMDVIPDERIDSMEAVSIATDHGENLRIGAGAPGMVWEWNEDDAPRSMTNPVAEPEEALTAIAPGSSTAPILALTASGKLAALDRSEESPLAESVVIGEPVDLAEALGAPSIEVAAFSADGTKIAAATGGALGVWRLDPAADGSVVLGERIVDEQLGEVTALDLDRRGQVLIFANQDGAEAQVCYLIVASAASFCAADELQPAVVSAVGADSDGEHALVGLADGTVVAYRLVSNDDGTRTVETGATASIG